MIEPVFAFSPEELAGDAVGRSGDGEAAARVVALDAGLRVVGLDDRLHVDHVALADHVFGRLGRLVPHVARVELEHELVGQRHLGRSDDIRLRVELRERVEDRVHRAHAHVADEQERLAVDRAELLLDRVEVGEDLRGMLAPAVAAVDDRDRGPERGFRRCALLEVPHRDDVGVELQHVDRVLHRLLVEVAGPGHLRVGEAQHVTAEAVHRGFGRHPGARARLVERRQQRLVLQQIGVAAALGDRCELVAGLEHALEVGALKVLERQDVAAQKAPHGSFSLLRCRGIGRPR